MPLELAIHKMTGLPASQCWLEAARIAARRLLCRHHDFRSEDGDRSRDVRRAESISGRESTYVIVNGQIEVDNGTADAGAGRASPARAGILPEPQMNARMCADKVARESHAACRLMCGKAPPYRPTL